MLVDSFSEPGVLPMGTWRALSERFAPRITIGVTDPEKCTPRNEQAEVAVTVALLMGGTKQALLKIARSSYTGLPIL